MAGGIALLLCFVFSACIPTQPQPGAEAMNQLAPEGKVRFGVAFAPEQSTFFIEKTAAGELRGVTVDLANELAQAIGRPVEFTAAPNTGVLTDALVAGTLDAAFMPVDDERKAKLGVGPIYFTALNTYLVRPGSDITTIAEVDRPGIRVIGIAGTTTIRSTAAALKRTKVEPSESVDVALEMLRSGQADAFALTHDTLRSLSPRVPGSRILEGSFREISIAIVVPKNRPESLAYVSQWLESAKASGSVRRAFDRWGFVNADVAPPSR